MSWQESITKLLKKDGCLLCSDDGHISKRCNCRWYNFGCSNPEGTKSSMSEFLHNYSMKNKNTECQTPDAKLSQILISTKKAVWGCWQLKSKKWSERHRVMMKMTVLKWSVCLLWYCPGWESYKTFKWMKVTFAWWYLHSCWLVFREDGQTGDWTRALSSVLSRRFVPVHRCLLFVFPSALQQRDPAQSSN